jgi:Phosphate acetyl/butaryl transferase
VHGDQAQPVAALAHGSEFGVGLLPDLLVEGPIQYDAAVEPSVAVTKMPDSPVAGRATVLIFPDLNTGNNTYKAVQRSADAIAPKAAASRANREGRREACPGPRFGNNWAQVARRAGRAAGVASSPGRARHQRLARRPTPPGSSGFSVASRAASDTRRWPTAGPPHWSPRAHRPTCTRSMLPALRAEQSTRLTGPTCP